MKRESEIAYLMTEARLQAGLTQAELARLMSTKQSVVARLETGGRSPSFTTLAKLAEVTGKRLVVRFV